MNKYAEQGFTDGFVLTCQKYGVNPTALIKFADQGIGYELPATTFNPNGQTIGSLAKGFAKKQWNNAKNVAGRFGNAWNNFWANNYAKTQAAQQAAYKNRASEYEAYGAARGGQYYKQPTTQPGGATPQKTTVSKPAKPPAQQPTPPAKPASPTVPTTPPTQPAHVASQAKTAPTSSYMSENDLRKTLGLDSTPSTQNQQTAVPTPPAAPKPAAPVPQAVPAEPITATNAKQYATRAQGDQASRAAYSTWYNSNRDMMQRAGLMGEGSGNNQLAFLQANPNFFSMSDDDRTAAVNNYMATMRA